MIQRVRDKIRSFKPQQVIPYADWKKIKERFDTASLFIQETNTAYQIMLADLEEAKAVVLQNRIHEVREIHIISDILQKIFITPREEQLNELVGQIKYIEGYLAELHSWIDHKISLEKLEDEGQLIIKRTQEE